MRESERGECMTEIRWHGRGGQGAFTASKLLGAAAAESGQRVLSFPSFGPERRGAPIQAFTKIGGNDSSGTPEPVVDRSAVHRADYIVFLDETLFRITEKQDLKDGGLLFVNSREPEKYSRDEQIISIDADGISERLTGQPVSNTVMLAVLCRKTGLAGKDALKRSLHCFLSGGAADKNESIIDEIFASEGEAHD